MSMSTTPPQPTRSLTDFEKAQNSTIQELSKTLITLAFAYFGAVPPLIALSRTTIANELVRLILDTAMLLVYAPMGLSLWYGNRLQRHLIWQLAGGSFDAYSENARLFAQRQLRLFFWGGGTAIIFVTIAYIVDIAMRLLSRYCS